MWFVLLKDYDMNVLYHPSKDNIVGDARSQMTMGSVFHLEEGKNDIKKDIAREVHRLATLGVRFEISSNEGDIVHHNSESSLVAEVKSKKHLD